jgi:hypothetical protein
MRGRIVKFCHAKQPKHGNGSAVRAPRARRSHTRAPPGEMREAAGVQPWMWAQRCGLWPQNARRPFLPLCLMRQVGDGKEAVFGVTTSLRPLSPVSSPSA